MRTAVRSAVFLMAFDVSPELAGADTGVAFLRQQNVAAPCEWVNMQFEWEGPSGSCCGKQPNLILKVGLKTG